MGSFSSNLFRIDYLAPAIQVLGIVPACPVLGSNEQIVDGGEHDW